MSNTHRNPAVRVLKQLTHEAIQAFPRDQVIRKLGLNNLLTPQERVHCQQQLSLLQQRLAMHEKMQALRISQKAARQSNKKEMPTAIEQQMPTAIEQQMPITAVIKQPFLTRSEQPLSATKQPLKTMSNKGVKQAFCSKEVEQTNKSAPQPSRFLSFFEPFGLLLQKPHIFNRQKRKSSQELMQLDDEQCQSLVSGDQEGTRGWNIQKIEHKKKD